VGVTVLSLSNEGHVLQETTNPLPEVQSMSVAGNARRSISDSRRCRRAAQTGDNQNGSLSAGKDPEPTHLILRFRDQAVRRWKALNDANSAS
jgi:hypothetical protein